MDHRKERIAEAIRDELGELIGYELSDPRVGSATVTEVLISPDKRHAFVRIRMGPEADAEATLAALEHASSFLRTELAQRLDIFRIPELHFEPDVSSELGARMDHLLKRIKKGRPRE
jgi:ribosome-binding factor A